MEASARLARREYMREWRAKNKDKIKVHQDRYWENKAKNLISKKENNKSK